MSPPCHSPTCTLFPYTTLFRSRKGIAVAAAPVCFEREMQTLTKDRVIAALRESLPKGSQMELIDFSQVRIPKGKLEFPRGGLTRSEEHTSELQSLAYLVCRLLL